MYRHKITNSNNGQFVYVNLVSSNAAKYLSRQPQVLNLLREAITTLDLIDDEMSIEQDMGRVIGNTDIVETGEKDTIYYAQPNKEKYFLRFAKNRYPAPCERISIIFKKDDTGDYEVTDTWIGPCIPPFPGEEDESKKSLEYWENHALVQDAKSVKTKTITKECPY